MTEPQAPMRRLLKYLNNYRKSIWLATSSSITNKVFDLMPPFLTAWIIDTVSGNTPAWIGRITGLNDTWSIIVFLVTLIFIIFGIESATEWLFKRTFMRLAQRVQHDLRLDTYQQLQNREIAFFETQRTGNLMSILNNDINQLERFLNDSFNEIIQMITLFLFAGWSLYTVSPELSLIGMFPIPFIILGSIYYQRKIAPYYQEVRETVGKMSNRLENNISGMAVIKSFTTEAYEQKRLEDVSEAYRMANFKAIRWSSLYVPVIRMFIALGFGLTLLLGSYQVLNGTGTMTLGGLAFFAMMIQRLLWPITRLGFVFDQFERARASARRVFGILDTPNQLAQAETPQIPKMIKGEIEFSKVHFHYHAAQPILRGLDLSITPGQTIGIAGATGAGKTTLIKLLLRLYDITNGSIKIDGVELAQWDRFALRRNIALVSQEVYLFHGSIRENIAYGMPDLSDEVIEKAARQAHLYDFIKSLPQQYDTIVGERGIKLSGGQRQRMSIARAILKNAPILLLDEATSSVDTETERAIQESLNLLTKGKTALIIAHRLSTIRRADQIIVLQEGQIAERGTHDYLLEQAGIYADLWKVQVGAISSIN